MKFSNEDMSRLIGDIYQCSIEPGRWIETLESISQRVSSCNATLMRHATGTADFMYHWGIPMDVLDKYNRIYGPLNPLSTIQWHVEPDEPVSLARFMTPQELRATRFYKEFIGPLGWLDFILVALEKSDSHSSFLSLTRLEADGSPTADDMNLVRLLAPHLRRALVLQGELSRQESAAIGLAATFDAVQIPIILLNGFGHVVEANAAARQFLERSGVVRLAGRELQSGGVRQEQDVGRLVHAAVHGAATALHADLSVVLAATDGRRFIAHAVPSKAQATRLWGLDSDVAAAIFIQEVGALKPLPGEALVTLYGLTAAETRLLALLGQGRRVEDAAEVLGIALSTARTHLKRIFQKTNTSRQAELVRLVLSAFPMAPD